MKVCWLAAVLTVLIFASCGFEPATDADLQEEALSIGASARPGFDKYVAWNLLICDQSYGKPTSVWFDCYEKGSRTPFYGFDVTIKASGSWTIKVLKAPSSHAYYVPYTTGTCDAKYCTFAKAVP